MRWRNSHGPWTCTILSLVEIEAEGPDEEEALQALGDLIRDKFDEVFRAEYRVSAEAVEAKALAVERIMKQA